MRCFDNNKSLSVVNNYTVLKNMEGKMKKTIILSLFLAFIISSSYAQRFAYIDTKYIMDNIPEYQAAQTELEQLSTQWQQEIEDKFQEVEELYKKYEAEMVLLPDDIKREREEEIIEKEKATKELQMKRFGQGGDLFKKREELIEPIQDKIYEAIEEIASRGNYAVIFDKAGGMTMIYTDVRYDLSDDVLQHLGYRR